MTLNDLLHLEGIDPELVLILRHRPYEKSLRRVFPWIAAEHPDLFDAYQAHHSSSLQDAMRKLAGRGYLASFIGMEPSTAMFVGLYRISGFSPITYENYWSISENQALRDLGMIGWQEEESSLTRCWFHLESHAFYSHWKGKLVVGWPPPERSWWRRAHKNNMPVAAIHPQNLLSSAVPSWDGIDCSWQDLQMLPVSWKQSLSHWRGIYYIFDSTDGKGYVGSAYGDGNLLGRWLEYARKGDGGNKQLRPRDPRNFRFTILQRVSPDMPSEEVIRIESSWKDRLHTRSPLGMNDN